MPARLEILQVRYRVWLFPSLEYNLNHWTLMILLVVTILVIQSDCSRYYGPYQYLP